MRVGPTLPARKSVLWVSHTEGCRAGFSDPSRPWWLVVCCPIAKGRVQTLLLSVVRVRSREGCSEGERVRCRPVLLEMLQPLTRLGDGWDVSGRDPPQREDGTLDRLEPLLSRAQRSHMR